MPLGAVPARRLLRGASKPLMVDLALTLASLNDNDLVATVHCYGFWSFSTNVAGCTAFG
ncbi:hypothetical protein ABTX60_22005 [Streptomyces sp. NPDC126510]|uniref:hypothetical protein n=1 Tax=Streptomyces sp. NPDC126510 TaxID=3155317 RepID=UPI0033242C5A